MGPSFVDAEGKGQRGKEAITAFYDNVISQSESLKFTIRQTIECGDEVANIGEIRITLPGNQVGIVPDRQHLQGERRGEARFAAFVLGAGQAHVQRRLTASRTSGPARPVTSRESAAPPGPVGGRTATPAGRTS